MEKIIYFLVLILTPTFSYATDNIYMIGEVEVMQDQEAIKITSELGGNISCGEEGTGAWILKNNSEVYDFTKSLILSAFLAELPVMISSSCDDEGVRVIDNIIVTKPE